MTGLHKIMAVLGGLLAPVLLVLALAGLNQLSGIFESKDEESRATFRVVDPVKKAPVKNVVKKKKPKPKRRVDPAPDLKTLLAGEGFGLDTSRWLDEGSLEKSLLDDIRDSAMTSDVVEEVPVILSGKEPSYPEFAIRKGIKGYVVVNLLVTANGRVEQTRILESEPDGVFDGPILEAVREWSFRPGRDKGRRVAVWVEQRIDFSLSRGG